MSSQSKTSNDNCVSDDHFENNDLRIDNYDTYDPMEDQIEIDNYSAIAQNISILKRFLSWFGIYDTGEQSYQIGDWTTSDNLELYNLDNPNNTNSTDLEDISRILKKEKFKRIKKTVIKATVGITVLSLLLYIIVNLAIVNKEYKNLKEAQSIAEGSVSTYSSSSQHNIFLHKTKSSSTLSTKTISSKSTKKQSSTTTSSSSCKSTKTSTTSTKTTKTKFKTKSAKTSTSTSTATYNGGLLSHLNDFWDDAKDLGENLKEDISEIVEIIDEKIHDHVKEEDA
ncbi:hypothetical protein HANVADRAFT_51008 [Hanseniaspora valbyensis NRRL Y-1626]|uniref:Uncharacterized protein n=1 Tax=Hanseniaspora valbyensis NRRL Y-1626 TaxID=766949 RepID=A0A1B7TJY8_9ASCO|nr:hypothetical protein HANVADRAFT_51008 [Hanseniaspora valbyensis NRRL Y-1626]